VLRPAAAGRQVSRGQLLSFLGGILLLLLSFETPFDALAEQYITAHMVQHLVVTVLVPPLLLLGTPAWLIEPWFRSRTNLAIGRFVTRPVVAFALFNIPFALIHLPVLYELMVRNTAVHLISHATFLVTALLLW
jgi:putative membrane protein